MPNNKIKIIISIITLSALTSCALKSYFPDKEQDYQFSQEIPPLIIPQDLENNPLYQPIIVPPTHTIENSERKNRPATHTEDLKIILEMVEGEEISTTIDKEITPKPKEEKTKEHVTTSSHAPEKSQSPEQAPYVDFVMFDAGATRLRTNEEFITVWRLIAKTLSREKIEITHHHRASGEFVVQYDPNKTNFSDDGVQDEWSFIFSGDHSQEQAFHIRLLTHSAYLEIIVLDDNNTPLSDGAGLKLLKLIFKTLHLHLTVKK